MVEVYLDSSPDRWGQLLMDRREAMMARDEKRPPGFLWGKHGWRLAPAFDMNPSVDKHEHVLTIDGLIADPDIELAVAMAGFLWRR